jgi:succinoglycan biosynthesis transport protein ExoP
MNHPDRPPGLTPHTEIVPAAAAYELDVASADLPAAGKKITLGLVARAVRRHWWQAALIWAVGSVGLMALVYFKVKPTYLAFSRVRVEPAKSGLFLGAGDGNFGEFKETQVNIISQPTVLEAALSAHPELLTFQRLAQTDDPIAEIRSTLNVGVVKGTNLIEVATSTESPLESAAIVNAVVDAYVKQALDTNSEETDQKVRQLEEARLAKEGEVTQKRNAIKELQKAHGDIDVTSAKDRNSVTIEEYRTLSNELLRVQIEIVKAEAQLAQLQAEQPAAAVAEGREVTESDLTRLFYSDKRVVEVRARFDAAEDKYKAFKAKHRNLADPAAQRPINDMKEAKADLDALWKELKPQLESWARRGATQIGGGGVVVDNPLKGAEATLAALKAQELSLTDKLNTLNIRKRQEGATTVSLEFDRMDLSRAEAYLDTISRNLADLKFQMKSPILRIRKEFPAKPSPRGTNNRLKVMAVAPVGVLFGVLGLLVFLELHAGRVVDPEELTARSRVPVVGVVPPLPQVRPQGGLFSGRDEFKAQRQLDQFVQSLDHLRVALCSGRDAWGRDRRVILITSACGSEGKTTLAAQLAERCVNAGLHTLLIDGDLRNPTLSRMLDVPNNRGLINVLRGECLPDEAISVVGGAGGFHFMPSGTPKVDPSRLLHGDRLGKFLAQAREGFDIVIVDAPPVLPVPDALTIGRWTDGAVLAVRCDTSRFTLVEKANRRLATVGVPVIGAVVNGVRVAESTYGSYYPSYAYTDDRSAPLDV